MIKLNLLPPEEKTSIIERINLLKIIKMGSFSLFFLLIFLLLLASIWWYLSIQLESADSILKSGEATPQGKALGEFKKEVDQANKLLKSFDSLQTQIINYSFALQKLTEIVPAGINFKSLSISNKDIKLEGHADTREILVSFKDVLESSQYFEKINSPLSNFLKQKDISFSFSFQIK